MAKDKISEEGEGARGRGWDMKARGWGPDIPKSSQPFFIPALAAIS